MTKLKPIMVSPVGVSGRVEHPQKGYGIWPWAYLEFDDGYRVYHAPSGMFAKAPNTLKNLTLPQAQRLVRALAAWLVPDDLRAWKIGHAENVLRECLIAYGSDAEEVESHVKRWRREGAQVATGAKGKRMYRKLRRA